MRQDAVNFINTELLRRATLVRYDVKSVAPSTFAELVQGTGLVVWSGASDSTIFQDASVNWLFRALHDALHLKTGLGFDHGSEVELGRVQARMFSSDLMQDLVYAQVAEQAIYHEKTGLFVADDKAFTIESLKTKGYKI